MTIAGITSGMDAWYIGLSVIFIFVLLFGYFIICEMVMKGQTLGKRVLKLRVIRENGQPIGAIQSIVRNIFRYFIGGVAIGVICILFSQKTSGLEIWYPPRLSLRKAPIRWIKLR